VLAVAGPRLAAAAREVDDVAAAHDRVDRLTGAEATVESVLAGLATADVAHLAVHGELREDNPLFSSLELVDGVLTGYDLESLPRVPRVVVLPACHSGRGRSLAGDEMLGLAWTLLGAGATTVVATTTAVPDDASADLMAAMHRHLGAGLDAATALCRAQAGVDPDDPLSVATAASFVSVGA
jgi:CHAT domain-containing protein